VRRPAARAGGRCSAFATRITGSPDLFAARWEGGDGPLPGGLAAGRRPAFGVNALAPPLAGSLLALLGADVDLRRAEIVGRSVLLALLVAQVRLVGGRPAGWRLLGLGMCLQQQRRALAAGAQATRLTPQHAAAATAHMCVCAHLAQGTPCFNAPTVSKGVASLLQFVNGVLQLRKRYQELLSPPKFDSRRFIRCARLARAVQRSAWCAAWGCEHGVRCCCNPVLARA
jgi:hypothetical protein